MFTVTRFGRIAMLLAMSALGQIAAAEYTKGTMENPTTREYSRGVYRDWQEGISLDTDTGNYLVTYKAWHGFYNQVVFEPATKIDGVLKSKHKIKDRSDIISYTYRLKSEPTSKQLISSMRTAVSIETSSLATVSAPEGWLGSLSLIAPGAGSRLAWRYRQLGDSLGGLAPGKSIDGFRLETGDLPGVGIMRIQGASRPTTWLGNAPDFHSPVGQQVAQLEDNDFIARFAAVPKIPNPQPFDAGAVLTSLQKHVKEDIVNMKLIAPVFAAQIDRGLQAALDAAKRGNTAGLKGQIKELRLILKGFGEPEEVDHSNAKDDIPEDQIKTKAWPHPISKLAARVIDFDLEYIEKRVRE